MKKDTWKMVFSEYFLYFCRYIALIWAMSMAYPPRLLAHN